MKILTNNTIKHLPSALLAHSLIEGGKYVYSSFFRKGKPDSNDDDSFSNTQHVLKEQKDNMPKP